MKSKSTRPRKPVAVVTIRSAHALGTIGRRRVATWLRRQARSLEAHGVIYDDGFVARLHR